MKRTQRGLSLIDLMVGLAIGMAAMLVTLNVAVGFDARRRSVTGIADAQGHAIHAIALISRELRMAGQGLGLPASLGCIVHRAAATATTTTTTTTSDASVGIGAAGVTEATGITSPASSTSTASTPDNAGMSFVLRPAVIDAGVNGESDALHTLSAGAGAAPAAWLIAPYATDAGLLQVDTTVGMAAGDYLLMQSDGLSDCALLKIAGFGTGSSYAIAPHVVPGLLPGTVFDIGTAVINVGALRYRRYRVDERQRLRMESFNPDSGLWTGATLAEGVAKLQLQYGFDARAGTPVIPQVTFWSHQLIDADSNGSIDPADWRRLLALRFAVVVRSSQRNDGGCIATAPQWLAGHPTTGQLEPTPVSVAHLPDWRCWRYRVLQTEVPLRNLIWGSS